MTKRYMVYKTPRSTTWSIYEISTGYNHLVEGGFFSRAAALEACVEWKAGTR